MRATADTIWRVPVYLSYLQPALTDEAVAAAEKMIGYKLPEEYLALLGKQNGGYIRFSLPDDVDDMGHERIAGIGPYFPSLTDFDWEESQECVSYPLQGLIPFDGDGHWHLCLDYRKNVHIPAITFADVECDQEMPVAGSFAEYLTMLRISIEEDEYVLKAVPDIEKLKADLSRELGCSFDPPDAWAHGYLTQRASLGTKGGPQWLWLSPNTVPCGFVRPDDRRYSDLKDVMPGVGERFPGLPADSYILNVTDGVKARVL
ncbi:MAG: SMI1/KNR4 family protein, partial [Zoogloeaceae bacterium]|nr:SMI1/KNR4 family protein [Zoogloeaceae bacterium]